jgi:CheY-like chemotaxis protein
VWNLLSNASKFTPAGGVVGVRVIQDDVFAEIVVSDTGPGITPEFLPHVFERFRQADGSTTRTHGGLGLGLAIVRHLVELHGGTVSAESEGEGKGATFRVVLPVRPLKPNVPAETRPVESAIRTTRPGRLDGLRVLVVDDEPDSRELFGSILEGAGAMVRVAASATEAIGELAAESADVLVCDIEMPGQDGYQLLERVRSDGIGQTGLIAVAVTAYARTADRRRALEAGFNWHLPKPVEPADLVSVIASLVNSQAGQPQPGV